MDVRQHPYEQRLAKTIPSHGAERRIPMRPAEERTQQIQGFRDMGVGESLSLFIRTTFMGQLHSWPSFARCLRRPAETAK